MKPLVLAAVACLALAALAQGPAAKPASKVVLEDSLKGSTKGKQSGGKFGLDLAKGDYTARRYDPCTGGDKEIGSVAGGGVRTFSTPPGEDWVIYLLPRADKPSGKQP
jgi:hypothetical protein